MTKKEYIIQLYGLVSKTWKDIYYFESLDKAAKLLQERKIQFPENVYQIILRESTIKETVIE